MDSVLSSPSSMTPPRRTSVRRTCRRVEKLVCMSCTVFPLAFVYSITGWAAYTEIYSISWREVGGFQGFLTGGLGALLYGMAVWSYTYAVFKKPGSPLDHKNGYSHLPTTETTSVSSVTVKSSGQSRFCKKCQFLKPDRTHHCSSCNTCVLKMDHHCPWLATCLGLYNYKAFLLFLIYTSLFCIVCLVVSSFQIYETIFIPQPGGYPSGTMDDLTPVNWILLAVVSGIIGIVLSGFTIWHLHLTGKNMTTIESMEKVRYSAPSLRGVPPPGASLVDDNPQSAIHREHQESFNRYSSYLLEEASKKLPHAFNLGRKRNFATVFGGSNKLLLWPIPVFSGEGNGFAWETSSEWRDAVEKINSERFRWTEEQRERERRAGWGYDPEEERTWNQRPPEEGLIRFAGRHKKPGVVAKMMSKAERVLGKTPEAYLDSEAVPLKDMRKKKVRGVYDISSDDDGDDDGRDLESGKTKEGEWDKWND
ncbi:zf-DHHC-domain-containing protein [Ascodesmis nigricans]|uniref:Palmitoyltransferase n=1 Tax=Ascodesmis nigricans TaxID=341454 RepID=A0A4S2N1N2_9PEZI|nr:zf-DHHC-domain-containing protein [Ascodesmis nigricans]